MGQNLSADLNIIANAPLELSYLDGDLDIIAKLDDEPNDVGGLTSAQLKAKFDEAGNLIKTYLNEELIPALLAADATEAARTAAETARASAESARAAAETLRISQESARQSAEEQRAAAETARTEGESARTAAESARTAAESTRAAAETARASAETARAAAESLREDSEQGYVAQAAAQAQSAKSWAVGGTGSRAGEDVNNAKYWAEQAQNAAGGGVVSFHGRTGAVEPQSGDYSKEQVGLGNVDNTADADKPLSSAAVAALAQKLPLSGGQLSGALTLAGDPTAALHAVTKQYADTKAPAYAYGTADLSAGTSALASGTLYFVYE